MILAHIREIALDKLLADVFENDMLML